MQKNKIGCVVVSGALTVSLLASFFPTKNTYSDRGVFKTGSIISLERASYSEDLLKNIAILGSNIMYLPGDVVNIGKDLIIDLGEFTYDITHAALEINFNNTELEEYLKEYLGVDRITGANLLAIKELHIIKQFSNNDLSDLSKLSNLKELYINDMYVDATNLSDLTSLKTLWLTNCTIKNNNSLPNSVSKMVLEDCLVEDDYLATPFALKKLVLDHTSFINLKVKNPEQLRRLEIFGNTFLDFTTLEDCTNLYHITLHECANVTNLQILEQLSNLEYLNIDDYAAIWMNKEMYEVFQDKISGPKNLYTEIMEMDNLASSLGIENSSDEEKINKLLVYILEKLTYDSSLDLDGDRVQARKSQIKESPISSAMYNGKTLAISYASLFQALANRVGLSSYQVFSKDNSWILYDGNGQELYIDPTMLDKGVYLRSGVQQGNNDSKTYIENGQGNELFYYSFTANEVLDNEEYRVLKLPEEFNGNLSMGYVKNRDRYVITFDGNNYEMKLKYYALGMGIILIAHNLLKAIKKDNERNKNLKKTRSRHCKH